MSAILHAALLISISATVASAEAVRVLSGEHDDFSRIVLVFDKPTTWVQNRSHDGFSVRFSRPDLDLDLSRVFSLIPKDRIKSIEFDQGSSTLEIGSSCQCELEIFKAGENTVALDVKDSDAPVPRVSELPIETPFFPFGLPARTNEMTPGGGDEQAQTVVAAKPKLTASKSAHPDPMMLGRLSDRLETALSLELDRAVAQGLVDGEPNARSVDQTAGYSAEAMIKLPTSHFRSETVLDQMWSGPLGPIPVDKQSIDCPPTEMVDVARWFDPTFPTNAISVARLGIDPADPSESSLLSLAQAYVGAGFGAEAIALLSEYRIESVGIDLVRQLAKVVDDVEPVGEAKLVRFGHCGGAYPLWVALSSESASDIAPLDMALVQKAFTQLPPHHRLHLGPILTRRLFAAGFVEAAELVRGATVRLSDASPPALKLVDVQFRNASGSREGIPEDLRDIVNASGEHSAEALVELMRFQLANRSLEADTILLAESMAHEYRGSEMETLLMVVVAEAKAATADIDGAVAILARMNARSPEEVGEVSERILRGFIAAGDGPAVLNWVAGDVAEALDTELPEDILLPIAKVLLEMRLPEISVEILNRSRASNSLAARRLRAQAALQMRDLRLALSLIAGEGDEESRLIRDHVLSQLDSRGQISGYSSQGGDRAVFSQPLSSTEIVGGEADGYEVGGLAASGIPVSHQSPDTISLSRSGDDISLGGATALVARSRDTRRELEFALDSR